MRSPTWVAKGGDDLVHESLQNFACGARCVGDDGLPYMHSCLTHSVPHIGSGHEQQSQHLQHTTYQLLRTFPGLCRYICAGTSVQVRLCRYICAGTPVSTWQSTALEACVAKLNKPWAQQGAVTACLKSTGNEQANHTVNHDGDATMSQKR